MSVPTTVSSSSSQLLPLALGLSAGALIVGGIAFAQLKKFQARWSKLLQAPGNGNSLEEMLLQHLEQHAVTARELSDARKRIERLEEQMQAAKRYVGVINYDAFPDVGGSQSFALAVYDDRGDGAVVTSQVGRTDCRVYCKPLSRGRADRPLSEEEQRALDVAYQGGGRPVIRS